MAIQRYDGYPASYDSGTPSPLSKIVDATVDAACDIYRRFPAFASIGDLPPFSAGTAAGLPSMRQMLEGACSSRGALPPAPTPQPPGGRCNCVAYRVTVRISRDDGTVQNLNISTTGAVQGIGMAQGLSQGQYQIGLYSQTCTNNVPSGTKYSAITGDKTASVAISNIVRLDGQADNCGNLPPADPVKIPPAGDISKPLNVTISPNITAVVPFVFVPVTIAPTFAPQLRVDVGGINLKLDLGGIDVFLPDTQDNPDTYPIIPPGNNPSLPGGGGNKPVGGGGSVQCPDPCPTLPEPETKRFLKVVLTKLPDKCQYGDAGQQNVYFAGWVAFQSSSGGFYPREQINFQTSVFQFPDDSLDFTITFTNGSAGTTTTYEVEP